MYVADAFRTASGLQIGHVFRVRYHIYVEALYAPRRLCAGMRVAGVYEG